LAQHDFMKNKTLVLYAFGAALGGFLFGFDTAVVNGALEFFRKYLQLEADSFMEGWVVGSALLGCVVGAIMIGRLGDKYGRRYMLRIMAFLILISAVGTGLATEINSFVAMRIIGGLGVGGASVLSPMYISEMAPAKVRGRLTVTFQLAIVIGILVAFFSDYLLINIGENNWRWMFIVEGIPALIFFLALFMVGRSPRWLVKNGKIEEAKNVITKVNWKADPNHIINEIKESLDEDVIEHLKYLFKKPYLRLVIVGILIGMFNQFTGINVVMYYSAKIFLAAGFSSESSILQTVIVGATNLVFTLIAMAVIDRLGRKKMLLLGALLMTAFLGLFAYLFLASIQGLGLLIMLVLFVGSFAFSQGAVVWVILSEMFPNNIRARATSIGSFSLWVFCFITTLLFPIVVGLFEHEDGTNNGIAYIFIFYAAMTLISFFFFRKYLYETKGKTLEELEKEMLKQ
jgi:sugar porter (SP) family MFS transporter